MNLRKVALTGLLALAAVAFAAPSMASASWLHNHKAITETEIIEFEGQAGFGSGLGGTTCPVSGAIEATAGSTTGHLIEFVIGTHKQCTSGGAFAGCEIAETPTVTNSETGKHIDETPLPVHIKTTAEHQEPKEITADLVLTNLTIDTFYTHPDADCSIEPVPGVVVPITGNALHFKEITLTPDNSTTINEFEGSGSGEVTIYSSTAAQAANMPFSTQAVVVNEETTEIGLTEPATWGIH
jgi:hypothetical protein